MKTSLKDFQTGFKKASVLPHQEERLPSPS